MESKPERELKFCPICGKPNVNHPVKEIEIPGGKRVLVNQCVMEYPRKP